MRFLANENFPGTAVAALIAAGHNVVWVRDTAPGTSDPDVLAWAARDERTLLTFDRQRLRRTGQSISIAEHVRMPNPGDIGPRLSNLLMSRDDWAGHYFSVIEPGRIRMRPLG
jgi:hypothetical protein